MRIQINDGVAIFATHFISAAIDRTDEKIREKLAFYQVEADGIAIYPDQDVLEAEWALRELKIPYTVEVLQPDLAHVAKTQGIKYASRSEAIAHLLEGKEPESLALPNLIKRLAEKEVEIVEMKNILKAKGFMK